MILHGSGYRPPSAEEVAARRKQDGEDFHAACAHRANGNVVSGYWKSHTRAVEKKGFFPAAGEGFSVEHPFEVAGYRGRVDLYYPRRKSFLFDKRVATIIDWKLTKNMYHVVKEFTSWQKKLKKSWPESRVWSSNGSHNFYPIIPSKKRKGELGEAIPLKGVVERFFTTASRASKTRMRHFAEQLVFYCAGVRRPESLCVESADFIEFVFVVVEKRSLNRLGNVLPLPRVEVFRWFLSDDFIDPCWEWLKEHP